METNIKQLYVDLLKYNLTIQWYSYKNEFRYQLVGRPIKRECFFDTEYGVWS